MGIFDIFSQTVENMMAADNGGDLADGTQLYMDQEISFNDTYNIVDAEKNPVYMVKGNLTSHAFHLKTADGADVAEIKKKLVAMGHTYEISFTNGHKASLKKKVALVKQEFNGTVNGKELQIKGDIPADNFEVFVGGQKIGAVAKRFLSVTDAYVISFVDESWKEIMVALSVAIDNACHNNSDD